MTNAAALALAYLRRPQNVVLHVAPAAFPTVSLSSAAHTVLQSFLLEEDDTASGWILQRVRFCENYLREAGQGLRADRMAAIGRLLSWGLTRPRILSMHQRGLVLLADREGDPVLLAGAKGTAGAPIPRNPKTGRPEVAATLLSLDHAHQTFAASLPPVCPVCLRRVPVHASTCPMSVPIDPAEVDTFHVR